MAASAVKAIGCARTAYASISTSSSGRPAATAWRTKSTSRFCRHRTRLRKEWAASPVDFAVHPQQGGKRYDDETGQSGP